MSINGRVVKSHDVEVLTPWVVECKACLHLESPIEPPIEPPTEPPIPVPDFSSEMKAKEEAAMIIAAAEASAQEIRDQAHTDAGRLRQEVTQTAQAEIYPVAQANGYQAGLEAGEAEGKRVARSETNQLFQLAQRAVQVEYAKVDEALLTLALKIAERLVRSNLAIDPQRLGAIIRALCLLPQEREGWRLHVAPEDAGWLKDNQPPCPWVEDESLSPGDCFLECKEGIFDARLEAQLDKLGHILREELEHGGLERTDSDGGTD